MIKNALKEANCDPEDEEAQPINSAGDGEQWSAARIVEQMEFIGDQITAVSTLKTYLFEIQEDKSLRDAFLTQKRLKCQIF